MRLLLIFLLSLSPSLSARADRVDDYIRTQMQKYHIPGVSVAVVKNGKVLKAKSYGLANVELSVPATNHTVYRIFSLSKHFTSTAIMMLVEGGKFTLDTKVESLLPDLPKIWAGITVRHLLTHTSGIRDTGVPESGESWEEFLKKVSGPLVRSRPGEQYSYNQTGYALLAAIIEKVSGKTFEQFVKERIFDPLGMNASRFNSYTNPVFFNYISDIIPNLAGFYSWDNGILKNWDVIRPAWFNPAAGLCSSILDLAKWDAALYTDRLLKRSSIQEMWTQQGVGSEESQHGGLGWALKEKEGQVIAVWGTGAVGAAIYLRRLDTKLTVILLANLDSGDNTLAESIAQLYATQSS